MNAEQVVGYPHDATLRKKQTQIHNIAIQNLLDGFGHILLPEVLISVDCVICYTEMTLIDT